ncbi:uncharacterized protein LOC121233048 isoform X1 [Aquila chrysaetos chrysaetos]|uniref:uncharacterized protein LOC121233048 isoform X1 n=1 Tax=Aquila chrysaetos chrysaetos TaxID=223781 RepID=UPI001B7D4326|nr:uncharacterized protein LOC121233048 isoform X1 [Aquila chrysaetos chrysaetos]
MKQQLMECSAAVHASQESYPDHAIEEKFIKKFQLMDALRNKVKQNDNDSCLILETMKHIILLSTAILESQQVNVSCSLLCRSANLNTGRGMV